MLVGRQTENVVMREAGPRDPSLPTVSEHLGLAGTGAGDQFCLVSPCFDSALFRQRFEDSLLLEDFIKIGLYATWVQVSPD